MKEHKFVEKPIKRGKLRQYFGTEYFILKRKLRWIRNKENYAKKKNDSSCQFCLIRHKSFLLRPLKDIDMILQHNKVTNLRLASEKIDGIVIYPNETFSIWKLVGRTSKRKGYLEGMTLQNGQVSKGVGGGLCQLGNLLYWMALHTDLTVTERYRHGFDVFPDINRKIPFACGATLSYNYIDLQLRNDTPHTYMINLWLDDEYLNGEIKCNDKLSHTFEVKETDHMIRQQWWGGYTRHNRIWKQCFDEKRELISENLVSENYAIIMYNPLLSDGKSNYSK